jgi:small conductance mechanosensitive channel
MDSLDTAVVINEYVMPWSINIALAIAILVIGLWVVKGGVRVADRLMQRTGMDAMLTGFFASILRALLTVVVVIAALDQLGVHTTSLIAVLGAAGLAIGLALQGSLGNLAAGVMIILFKPFRVGDFIEAAGAAGVVEQIRIFQTVLRTPDNREIIIPNGKISDGIIVNVTARNTRRVDLVFGIGYGDDLARARELIQGVIDGDERILGDPAPAVVLADLADSSVNIAVRPWVNSGDYWAVRADPLEKIKAAFDSNGINIPYPQRDVHLYQAM